uniref:Protein kinase domain-containing protein n=1 Tax=Acrobeloides nanus TaxID=290746 RepID=A0A914E2B1_9BILA
MNMESELEKMDIKYWAPERYIKYWSTFPGRPIIDDRTDVYSLGWILYVLLCKGDHHPFPKELEYYSKNYKKILLKESAKKYFYSKDMQSSLVVFSNV